MASSTVIVHSSTIQRVAHRQFLDPKVDHMGHLLKFFSSRKFYDNSSEICWTVLCISIRVCSNKATCFGCQISIWYSHTKSCHCKIKASLFDMFLKVSQTILKSNKINYNNEKSWVNKNTISKTIKKLFRYSYINLKI